MKHSQNHRESAEILSSDLCPRWVQEPITAHGGAVLSCSPNVSVARQRQPIRSVSKRRPCLSRHFHSKRHPEGGGGFTDEFLSVGLPFRALNAEPPASEVKRNGILRFGFWPVTAWRLSWFIGLMFGVALSGIAAVSERPNIILAMADDMGWGDVGFNGNTIVRTPNLDSMARSGIRFDRFYAPTVCSPTRGSCMTGRHPIRYGILGANVGHLPGREVTLAELLRQRGYVTGHFGKWHLGTLTKTEKDSNRGGPGSSVHFAPPWEHGFDVTFSTEAKVPTWDPMRKPPGANQGGPWWNAILDDAEAAPYGTAYWSHGRRVTENLAGDDSRVIMDRAIPFIQAAAASGKPFFAVIWFHAPHLPVVAGPEYAALYPNRTPYERNYFGCITALDEQMGRLREMLRKLGESDNTMLWFCSDNGPEGRAGSAPGTAGPFKGRKRDLWEGGIRVPGLLEWPAVVKENRVTAVPCVTSDYLPTILDFVGIDVEAGLVFDGVSLRTLIAWEINDRPVPIGFEFGNMAVWLDNRFKLVAMLKGGESAPDLNKTVDKWMLFDVPNDPREERDLSAEYPARVRQMSAGLEAWRKSCRESLRELGN